MDNIGNMRIGQERLVSMDLIDYKESFNFPSSFNLATDDQLPSTIKESRKETENFTRACHAVGCKVLRALAIGLGLEAEHFVKGHTYGKASGGIFRLLRYPAIPESVDPVSTVRAGSHSDYGTLTLLFQEPPPAGSEKIASGLQVNVDDSWHDVPSKKDCIVVNIADLLSFWTEGRLRSAVHHVILPAGELKNTPRYTAVFFMHPNSDHIIEPTPSAIPAPFPAKQDKDGHLVASFGPSPFTYKQTGKEYLWRRLNLTYDFAAY
ncbi:hypothetical protein DSO57_1000837 [Entomophthora muscae]|nr:hypothetical protein DSO57_1000837 [Entomophthora muscae]